MSDEQWFERIDAERDSTQFSVIRHGNTWRIPAKVVAFRTDSTGRPNAYLCASLGEKDGQFLEFPLEDSDE